MDRRNMGPVLAILTIILAIVVVAVSAGSQIVSVAAEAAKREGLARAHSGSSIGAQPIGAKSTWRP